MRAYSIFYVVVVLPEYLPGEKYATARKEKKVLPANYFFKNYNVGPNVVIFSFWAWIIKLNNQVLGKRDH